MDAKNKWIIAAVLTLLICLSVFYAGWQIRESTGYQTANQNVLFQLAAFNTFSTGQYAGFMTYADLEKHGDFGIGTFDGLDGEMLAFDGVFYQVPSTGIPRQAESTQTAPYATITYFHADSAYAVSDMNYTQLKAFLDGKFEDKEAIYAIKVSGDFTYAQTRSPQKQAAPYPDLTGALKTQGVFNLTSVEATAVGFWFPQSMSGVDYAGYHLHLITGDHAAGGHILDCIIQNATVEVDVIKDYQLILP
jgi:acetolactate decarboxylase